MPPSVMPDKPVLAQWILDTRDWYPEARQTKQLETHASRALSLLPPTTRPQILRYLQVRDAKLALASALLKHYAIAKLSRTPTPWSQTVATNFTQDPRRKPIYIDPATSAQPVSFNVSHQAGVVALVAVAGYPSSTTKGGEGEGDGGAQVGVDVVCTSERRARDLDMIAKEGWPAFVDMHADVFAPGEVAYLKGYHRVPSGGTAQQQENDGRLRAFYALWALREAYVKLTGEALLASWLRELEFRGFRASRPTAGWGVPAREEEGEVVRDMEIWFQGSKVEDVNMCLRSIGPDYMIATAVRTPGKAEDGLGWALGPYEVLSLGEVLDFAEASG
ncbi:hypothetical protein C8A01DRAFT_44980 [Parachaetomium inaequale]|uniref:holo-[acyl-carrier-protein] synthase n=1 Tax=Parachaetomium inaequale TaxID=2588326 RepID=A0AAN6PNB9_9PEZI|nr:hypothetical protein C8A01DRAFT_44980 [Parachaetomium inaequale]